MNKYTYVYKRKKQERAKSTEKYEKYITSKTEKERELYFENKIKYCVNRNKKKKRIRSARIIAKTNVQMRRKIGQTKDPKNKYKEFVGRLCQKRKSIHYELKRLHTKLSSFFKTYEPSIILEHETDTQPRNAIQLKIEELKLERLNHDRTCKECFGIA